MIPKSKNAKTGILQYFRPDIVFCQTFLMLTTIYFNNKFFFKASEIENIIFKWMLSTKFQTFNLSASQDTPEFPRGVGHIAS